MYTVEFEEFINGARLLFATTLKDSSFELNMEDMKKVLKNLLGQCTSSFEEETLKENLQEVFREYLDEVRVA